MQTRRSSLLEVIISTTIGFCVSLLATLTILPALDVQASASQSVVMTVAFTVISVVRGYAVRRMFNAPLGVERKNSTHYHIDSNGVRVYKSGIAVARIDLDRSQLVGLAQDALKASREFEHLH